MFYVTRLCNDLITQFLQNIQGRLSFELKLRCFEPGRLVLCSKCTKQNVHKHALNFCF